MFAIGTSPVVTRRRAQTQETTSQRSEATEPTPEAAALRELLAEVRTLRQEQTQMREEFSRREEELRREIQQPQLSTPSLSVPRSATEVESSARGFVFKIKPDTYDGGVPLREFLSQFSLIARANGWDDAAKSIALASSLRGRARAVLKTVEDLENLNFAELTSKLELLFGEGNSTQNYYSLFTSRKQKFGEDLASFGAEIERLSRLAYPECPYSVRDKIACAQFVSALSDNFVRQTLLLEGFSSLKLAVERAKVVKTIRRENFSYYNGKNFASSGNKNFEKQERNDARKEEGGAVGGSEKAKIEKRKDWRDKKSAAGRPRECWTCGKTGHF